MPRGVVDVSDGTGISLCAASGDLTPVPIDRSEPAPQS